MSFPRGYTKELSVLGIHVGFYTWRAGRMQIVALMVRAPSHPRSLELTLRLHGFHPTPGARTESHAPPSLA